MFNKLVVILLYVLIIGCEFPADPHKTLYYIQQTHLLKVGICSPSLDKFYSREKKVLTAISHQLNVKIIWSTNNSEVLYRQLEQNQLDIVACEINDNSPWNERIGFTVPFYKVDNIKYVFGIPPGENGWLHYINKFLYGTIDHETH